jgi:hypothetical protein
MRLSRSAVKRCVTTTFVIFEIVCTTMIVHTLAWGNAAPAAYASAVATTAGVAVDGVLQGSDPESGPLTYAIVTPPENGSAVITNTATGAFTYTPAPGYAGYDGFTFSVSDGAATATATQKAFTVAPDAGTILTVEWHVRNDAPARAD